MAQFSVQGQKSNGQMVSSYFNSKQEAEKEARELERLGHKNVKVAPATDFARKAPARLHRALDRVMDARGKAKDAVEGPYDVGYHDKAKGPMHSRNVVITAGSCDEAMRKAKAGARPGEELYRVSPREKNAVWAKDRVSQDCIDLGVLPVRAKDLNTTPPRDALASQAKARAWLERLQDQMQPAYAAEESARERYKNASRDQRDKYDLEKKWSAASAKVAQLEKEWDQAHAAIKRAIPGFEC
jgi:hypothetical protein